MENLKFIVYSIVILAVIGLIGYWSFFTMQSGSEHVASEKIKQLQEENENLKNEVEDLTKELAVLQPKIEEPPVTEETKQPIVYKYQDLINELQKLVDDNVFMKLKSYGTRVGTVQKFLNIYNNTSVKVDNDYGPGTVTRVKAFQKMEGLTADGEAGSTTFKKMIEWLKKQN